MGEHVLRAAVAEGLLGPSRHEIRTDRGKQASVALWLGAVVCFAVGLAARGPQEPQPYRLVWLLVLSAGLAAASVSADVRRGAVTALAIALVRLALFWGVLAAIVLLAAVLALVVPTDDGWLAVAWLATAVLLVVGEMAWDRTRRMAIAGVLAGLVAAFGSLALWAGGDDPIVAVVGVPAGLALLYASTRTRG
jgi:hypothetical protein